MVRCARCGTRGVRDDRYCERCGSELPQPTWLASTGSGGACPDQAAHDWTCGACRHCGQRRCVDGDLAELDLGAVAGLSHRGLRRTRNEDAVAIGRIGAVTVAVVADGVASTPRSHTAARTAVETGIAALLAALAAGAAPAAATSQAATTAAEAVAALGDARTDEVPPSCTYISMVSAEEEAVIGWVGDSRAYWLTETARFAGSRCLTVDDTVVADLARLGTPVAEAARSDLGALTRWMGADAPSLDPRVTSFDPRTGGALLLCTDGLSRYIPAAADLAAVVLSDAPVAAARRLNQLALNAGGRDNITVVVARSRARASR